MYGGRGPGNYTREQNGLLLEMIEHNDHERVNFLLRSVGFDPEGDDGQGRSMYERCIEGSETQKVVRLALEAKTT